MPGRDLKKEFTEIFERENDALYRFCYWRVTNRERAIELTQESFARLWSRMAGGKAVENPRAFLYIVAKHMIIDWYRKTKPRSLESLYEDEDRPFDPGDEEAAENMETSSDARRALDMINMLDKSYRDVVYMRFVEDLPPRDIAKILKLTPNAVSVRITKGLRELRRIAGLDK